MTSATRGPVQVPGEVLSNKRAGAYQHLAMTAPGVAERFRPGSLVTLAVGGPLSDRLLRRAFPIYRARATGTYKSTVEVLFRLQEPGQEWLARLAPGAALDVVGPLGRPFALPKEPVACTLVGHGPAVGPLFSLAERLRTRGCAVHMVLAAPSEKDLFGALDAKRSAKTVVVVTEDGSVGMRGPVGGVLPDLLARSGSDVVYASGPSGLLHDVALVAEQHGAWSQTALDPAVLCVTGACHTCVVPVVGEDGVTRMLRTCVEGPVLRGDRVRWADLGTVPEDCWGVASRPGEG